METVLRAGALFGGSKICLTLAEMKYKDLNIVAFRFDEEKQVKQDVNDIRFNFTPCFVRVGNQFVFCSTVDLCKELVDLLQAEAKAPAQMTAATIRDKFYSTGVAEILKAFEDQLAVQGALDQGIPADKAKEQVRAFIAIVRNLGAFTAEATFEEKAFRYELRATPKK